MGIFQRLRFILFSIQSSKAKSNSYLPWVFVLVRDNQYHIIFFRSRYPLTFSKAGIVFVDLWLPPSWRFKDFLTCELKMYYYYSLFNKIWENEELCLIEEIWFDRHVKNVVAIEMLKNGRNRITSTQAVIPLCAGCLFPPPDEWFAETNTFGVLLYFSVKRIS